MLTSDVAGVRYFQHTLNMGLGLDPVMSSTMSYKRSVPVKIDCKEYVDKTWHFG